MKSNSKKSWASTNLFSPAPILKIELRRNQTKRILKLFKAKTIVWAQKNKVKCGKKIIPTIRLHKTSQKKMKFRWRFTRLAIKFHFKCRTTFNKLKRLENPRNYKMILSVKNTAKRPINWANSIWKTSSPIRLTISRHIKCFQPLIFKILSPTCQLTIMALH
jgi:hypothetical protein